MAPSANKSAKKRKHASFAGSSTPYTVEVTPNDPAHDPVVVSFPRGVPTSILNYDAQAGNNSNTSRLPHFTWSKLKSSSDKGRRITGTDETCTYTSTSSGRGHDGRLTKLYVLALHKKEKTIKLIPTAEKGTTFALEQTVKAYKTSISSESGSLNQASAKDRVNMLVESFGSKKKQKVMASRAANVVNINNVVGAGNAMMESVAGQKGGVISEENREMLMDGSKVINTVDASLLEARKQVLPPFDLTANTPSKVFNPQEIASEGCWNQISRLVDKTLKNAQESGNTASNDWIDNLLGRGQKGTYIPESISQLFEPLDPFNKKGHIFRIKTAFFLYFMLRFHHKIYSKKTLIGDHEECIKHTRTPVEVGSRLIELFTIPIEGGEKNGYMITPRLLEKLQMHILILYVMASGNDMVASSVNLLLKDVKMDERRAMICYREAGFSVKKNAKKEIGVSLSVPLTFPPPKRGKK